MMGRKIVGVNKVILSLHDNLAELESEWLSLQEDGLCTLYQTYEWCTAWQATAGKPRSIKPLIVRGSTQAGKTIFILPFAVSRSMGANSLNWYGAAEITYGMGIFDREYLQSHPDFMEILWPEIVNLIEPIDSVRLDNQPEKLDGFENPLKFLFTTRGANQSYRMGLQSDFQKLYESKRSSSSRRSARKRDKKLMSAGKVEFGLPEDAKQTRDVISTMIEHQQGRLGEKGIRSVFDETRQAFLHKLAESKWQDGTRVLLPYNLRIDGNVCAVMLGGSFQRSYWALISSLTPDGKLHAFSPGDHALRATIEATCQRGLQTFDFASGDTEYKSHWNDEKVRLFETNMSATLKGAVSTAMTNAGTAAKRFVKQTPWLFSFAQSARKALLKKKS